MLLDGKKISLEIKEELKREVNKIKEQFNRVPTLAVILVGNSKASEIYVRNKVKACEFVGINSIVKRFSEDASEEEIIDEIKRLSADDDVNGIMVQLPLPNKFNKDNILSIIPASKDVDGLTIESVGRLASNKDGFIPCTPKGVVEILNRYNISVESKKVCIIGRSMLVGKPLSLLLENMNATVTMCHSKTLNLKEHTRSADIIVVAVGKANFLKGDMVSDGTVVIDVGINKIDDKLYGDVDFDEVEPKASYITPVPGGCGPMTVVELLSNTVLAFKKQND